MSVINTGNFTEVADATIDLAKEGFCDTHAQEHLQNLDFGQLASATVTSDEH
jgi:hypothetical protein